MTRWFTAYIGLGANLGDRRANIASALAALAAHEEIEVVRSSAIVETDPLPPPGAHAAPAAAPAETGGPYLNAVVQVRTSMTPRALLDTCLAIEVAHGRCRHGSTRWASRPLDLDVLLFGDALIDEPGLRIPHPRMHERAFVLEPLAQIAPRAVHPGLGRSVECLRDRRRRMDGGGEGADVRPMSGRRAPTCKDEGG